MIQKVKSSKRRQELENNTFETAEKEERLILVAVATSDGDETIQSLEIGRAHV